MKFIADQNMPYLAETFGVHGDLVLCNGREICRDDLAGAEVLLVRSITRVDRQLLQATGIQFVGSATIGIDHLDTTWLEANNITWAHAPGCNADAAAQYTLAMMWLACERLERDFRQQTVGIVGRGNVGGRLEHLLNVLNIPVMSCDPPLQDTGEQNLVSMNEVCGNSIISLHTPLTGSGTYPTRDLFDTNLLAKLDADTLVVNASRGGVIEKTGLSEQLLSGRLNAALDVWPDEPFIEPDMLDAVIVATPHVAGYSREGKLAGTQMIYKAFCERFAIEPLITTASETKTVELVYSPTKSDDEALQHAILASSQIVRDDHALRNQPGLSKNAGRIHIDSLRKAYPERFEFKSHRLHGISATSARLFRQLGFQID